MIAEPTTAPSKERIIEMDHETFFASPGSIIEEFDKVGFLFFVPWSDRMFCCDRMNDWAFADVDIPDDTGNPNSAWRIVTPPFADLAEALELPTSGTRIQALRAYTNTGPASGISRCLNQSIKERLLQ